MGKVGDGGGKCVCAENRYRTITYHLNLPIPIGFILQRRKMTVVEMCERKKLTQNIKHDLNLDIPIGFIFRRREVSFHRPSLTTQQPRTLYSYFISLLNVTVVDVSF